MTKNTAQKSATLAQELAASWLAAFAEAVERRDHRAVASLFVDDCHWRDVVSFTWHLHSFRGRSQLETAFEETLLNVRPSDFVLRSAPSPQWVYRAGTESAEAFFTFKTAVGRGSGLVRVVVDNGIARAWTLLTTLEELNGFEEYSANNRSSGHSREFGGPNWLDHRTAELEYKDKDPAVLVVGGGQSGVAIAARLRHLNVDTLIVDRMKRVGDNWRNRYHSLSLHNEVWVNHLPYLPFPDSWPVYLPKDKFANWLESYVEAMEINFWTGTEVINASYDNDTRTWSVRLRRDDGTERVMHPRHIVMATGVAGVLNLPDIPGLKDFAGESMHSSAYKEGSRYRGKSAIVFGTGTSGHDVAQDLYSSGVSVAIVQRNSTTISGIETAQKIYTLYQEGLPTADCDLVLASFTYPVLVRSYQLLMNRMEADDKELIDALNGVGFRTDYGEDRTGFQMKFLRKAGGYYFNVGCSELIIEGKIRLLQNSDIERIVKEGALLRDGSVVPADLIVLATGYKPQQELVRRIFGGDVADRLGPIWGYDEEGELRNIWKRTAQEGLWFHMGSLSNNRIFSRFLALQIKACEEGLIDKAPPAVPKALASLGTETAG